MTRLIKIAALADKQLGDLWSDIGNFVLQIGQTLLQTYGSKTASQATNDQFIDSLVTYSTQQNFVGFTHGDVVHLMPANWGTQRSAAIQQFAAYLAIGKSKTPGTNLVPFFSWGGGWVPDHTIYWKGISSTVTPVIPGVTPTPTTSASFTWWEGLLLIGAVGFLWKKGKARQ